MLFNSLAFAIFLPIVFVAYWVLPHKYRWIILLISSYFFYMSWNAKYIVLILFTTVVSYAAGILIEKSKTASSKKIILWAAIILCLGVLLFFKYFNFLSESISNVLGMFAIELHPFTLRLLLPVGISFYTFQTLGYVIDVYRGTVKAEHHFGIYATFISFFPQLVAGPIERTENLLPQIKSEKHFDYSQATYGLRLMLWGFFKKLVIADTVAVYVDKAYASLENCSNFDLMLAVFFFSIQIYCDFSGYSDIAIGTSKLLGVDLMTNFKSPYFASSIKEFWSRWHISLSTWFRDYVYIPMGGNRCSRIKNAYNLIITFLLSGLWHGANWTFVLWGGVHGIGQVIEKNILKKNSEKKILNYLRVILVFAFCNVAWVFFRANTIDEALYVISHLFSVFSEPNTILYSNLGISVRTLFSIGISILMLTAFDFASLKRDVIEWVGCQKPFIRWMLYFLLVFYIIYKMPLKTSGFIYFQF